MQKWSPSFLYTALVSGNDRHGKVVPNRTSLPAIRRFCTLLKRQLGGNTKIKLKDAIGDTLTWGRESTKIVFVVTESSKLADAVFEFATAPNGPLGAMNQDEIWIMRSRIALLKAVFPPH